MKKLVLILLLLSILITVSNAQYSSDKIAKAKKQVATSAGTTAVGGVFYLIFRYLKPGMSDDPGPIEQIMGDDGVNKTGEVCSVGVGIIGAVWCVGSLINLAVVEHQEIKQLSSFRISPELLKINNSKTYCAGFRLTYTF